MVTLESSYRMLPNPLSDNGLSSDGIYSGVAYSILWARHSIIIPAVVLLFIANVWNAGLLFTSSLERLIISSISWIDLIRYELGILVTEVPNEIVPQG